MNDNDSKFNMAYVNALPPNSIPIHPTLISSQFAASANNTECVFMLTVLLTAA